MKTDIIKGARVRSIQADGSRIYGLVSKASRDGSVVVIVDVTAGVRILPGEQVIKHHPVDQVVRRFQISELTRLRVAMAEDFTNEEDHKAFVKADDASVEADNRLAMREARLRALFRRKEYPTLKEIQRAEIYVDYAKKVAFTKTHERTAALRKSPTKGNY